MGQVQISQDARDDLNWWIGHLTGLFKLISHERPSAIVETDALKTGWEEILGTPTGGRWDSEEVQLHINCLELTSAFFGLKCFYLELRDTHVRLMIDNSTAVAYINAIGGMKSSLCNDIARQIWAWCVE